MPTQVTLTGPGNAIVVDDAGAAIAAQTTALTAELIFIDANLSQINSNLARIADASASISKALGDLNISVGTVAVAQNQNNAIQAAVAVNQIQTNNFQVEVTKQALVETGQNVPALPKIEEQIKTTIKEAILFNEIAVVEGILIKQINSTVVATGTWIAETAVYKTVTSWIKTQAENLAAVFPKSPASIKSILEALAGKKASS